MGPWRRRCPGSGNDAELDQRRGSGTSRRPWVSPRRCRFWVVSGDAQLEPTALALGMQTPASVIVAVNELRVGAGRAEDATRILLFVMEGGHALTVGRLGNGSIGQRSSPCPLIWGDFNRLSGAIGRASWPPPYPLPASATGRDWVRSSAVINQVVLGICARRVFFVGKGGREMGPRLDEEPFLRGGVRSSRSWGGQRGACRSPGDRRPRRPVRPTAPAESRT